MFKKTLFLAVLSLATATFVLPALASESSMTASAVVNKSTCSKMANTTQPFILILNSGDELISSISQCAKDAKLVGASISGLGQLHNPSLAYFSSDPKAKPTLTKFPGYYELASLNGNIAINGDNYFTHIHAALADKKFHGIAGHVNDAKIGLTAEISIIPFTSQIQRAVDPKTGFGPIVQ